MFGEDVTQKQLFDHVSFPVVDDLLHGKNGKQAIYSVHSRVQNEGLQVTRNRVKFQVLQTKNPSSLQIS